MAGSTCMRLINEISKKEDCRKLWMQNLFTFRQRCSESNNLYHVQTSLHMGQSGKRDFRGQDFIIIPMNLLFISINRIESFFEINKRGVATEHINYIGP
jgi:hypothetical protein